MDSHETKALVEKAQSGDRSAFDALVEAHRARIEALVRSRLGAPLRGRVTEDDILQETLLQAFRSLERFSWESDDAFFRWLGGIAENVLRKESRRHSETEKVCLDTRALDQL